MSLPVRRDDPRSSSSPIRRSKTMTDHRNSKMPRDLESRELERVRGGVGLVNAQISSYSFKDDRKPQRFDADYSADGNDI